jgi:glycosyltransferase involved in cell wall biosynthesis
MKDESLLKDIPGETEVMKLPIWEPYQFFFKILKLTGKKEVVQSDFISTGRKSLFQKISGWIRGNLFIPDARVFWVKPSVTFLKDFITANHIEKIITTGPPHSIHLIGLRLKRRVHSLRWVADFRDPWSEWDLLDTLSLTTLARSRHRKLEKAVLTNADRVITIAPYHVERLEKLSGRKVDLVTNGFDTEDFQEIKHQKTSKFTIRHIGIVDELRDPRPAMEALRILAGHNPEFGNSVNVEFIGNVNSSFKKYVQGDQVLSAFTKFIHYVAHNNLIQLYGSTDLQLLVLAHTLHAPGNLPGKFFEYLASGKPILALGPVEGDAAKILNETGAGKIFDRNDQDSIKEFISREFERWKQGSPLPNTGLHSYSREVITRQLANLLESL